MNYKFLDNAFWEAEDRSIVKCIKVTDLPDGKRKKEEQSYRKYLPDKSLCPRYKEVVASIGVEKIDANTNERKTRKERDEKEKRARHEQQKRTQELEILFNAKLQAFEIDEIKNSDDRNLRTKIRRAKNVVELNALTALLLGKELGVFGNDGTE